MSKDAALPAQEKAIVFLGLDDKERTFLMLQQACDDHQLHFRLSSSNLCSMGSAQNQIRRTRPMRPHGALVVTLVSKASQRVCKLPGRRVCLGPTNRVR